MLCNWAQAANSASSFSSLALLASSSLSSPHPQHQVCPQPATHATPPNTRDGGRIAHADGLVVSGRTGERGSHRVAEISQSTLYWEENPLERSRRCGPHQNSRQRGCNLPHLSVPPSTTKCTPPSPGRNPRHHPHPHPRPACAYQHKSHRSPMGERHCCRARLAITITIMSTDTPRSAHHLLRGERVPLLHHETAPFDAGSFFQHDQESGPLPMAFRRTRGIDSRTTTPGWSGRRAENAGTHGRCC